LRRFAPGDVEDFIADLRKPCIVNRRSHPRPPANTTINRTIELLRHILNWAVGREYLDHTPFRRGNQTLIKNLREDNKRRRRLAADEETRILSHATVHLRSAIIVALDTGVRQGGMLALRFGDSTSFQNGASQTRGQIRTSSNARTAGRPVRWETPGRL
jgi:hypothetical protein